MRVWRRAHLQVRRWVDCPTPPGKLGGHFPRGRQLNLKPPIINESFEQVRPRRAASQAASLKVCEEFIRAGPSSLIISEFSLRVPSGLAYLHFCEISGLYNKSANPPSFVLVGMALFLFPEKSFPGPGDSR